MAKKISTTAIGGFVITALMLLMTAVILFGSGSFWKKTEQFVLHFEESVKGLNVGSPVMFRGVEVGSVKSIVLKSELKTFSVSIPIFIEIDKDRFQLPKGQQSQIINQLPRLIELGLRAQLDLQSIVTGQLMIQLDYLPDTPAKLRGVENNYPEIPTIRSSINELSNTVKNIPIQEIAADLKEITGSIKHLLASKKIDQILSNLESTTAKADRLVVNVDGKIDSFSKELEKAITDVLELLEKAESGFTDATDSAARVLTNIDGEVQPVSDSLVKALDAAKATLVQAETTLVTVDDLVDHSDTRLKLNRSLDEITTAARSLASLADYLERHPDALLKGKR